jgi:cysteine desulfurase
MDLYLDANAHLPMSQAAINALVKFNSSVAGHGNPMSISAPGRAAQKELERSRAKIAEMVGAKSADQIFFTSTCTQACEWSLNILRGKYEKAWCSPMEHPAIRYHFRSLFGQKELNVGRDAKVACEFEYPEKTAVVCIHVQNEIGTIQNIENINAPVLSDMSQSLGKIPVDLSKMPNVKIAVFGAHKFGGPTGFGFMYLQDTSWWKEFGSGSRYYTDRPGTPDVGSAVATAAALKHALITRAQRYQNMIIFRQKLEPIIEDLGLEIIGKNAIRVPNTTFVHVGRRRGPIVMQQLEAEGMHVGLGSACGSLNTGPPPLMTALGHSGGAHDYIRISQWGDYGSKEADLVGWALKRYCPKPEEF